jgi:hypothetical protein
MALNTTTTTLMLQFSRIENQASLPNCNKQFDRCIDLICVETIQSSNLLIAVSFHGLMHGFPFAVFRFSCFSGSSGNAN